MKFSPQSIVLSFDESTIKSHMIQRDFDFTKIHINNLKGHNKKDSVSIGYVISHLPQIKYTTRSYKMFGDNVYINLYISDPNDGITLHDDPIKKIRIEGVVSEKKIDIELEIGNKSDLNILDLLFYHEHEAKFFSLKRKLISKKLDISQVLHETITIYNYIDTSNNNVKTINIFNDINTTDIFKRLNKDILIENLITDLVICEDVITDKIQIVKLSNNDLFFYCYKLDQNTNKLEYITKSDYNGAPMINGTYTYAHKWKQHEVKDIAESSWHNDIIIDQNEVEGVELLLSIKNNKVSKNVVINSIDDLVKNSIALINIPVDSIFNTYKIAVEKAKYRHKLKVAEVMATIAGLELIYAQTHQDDINSGINSGITDSPNDELIDLIDLVLPSIPELHLPKTIVHRIENIIGTSTIPILNNPVLNMEIIFNVVP